MKTSTREDLTLFLVGASFVVVMPIAMLNGHSSSAHSAGTSSERNALGGAAQRIDLGTRELREHHEDIALAGDGARDGRTSEGRPGPEPRERE